VKKCYWIFALAVMFGGMIFSVQALTKAYLSYPVSVYVSVLREKKIVFPAVTVCNMSPVKKSALDTADLSGAPKSRKKRTPAGLYTLSYLQDYSKVQTIVIIFLLLISSKTHLNSDLFLTSKLFVNSMIIVCALWAVCDLLRLSSGLSTTFNVFAFFI